MMIHRRIVGLTAGVAAAAKRPTFTGPLDGDASAEDVAISLEGGLD